VSNNPRPIRNDLELSSAISRAPLATRVWITPKALVFGMPIRLQISVNVSGLLDEATRLMMSIARLTDSFITVDEPLCEFHIRNAVRISGPPRGVKAWQAKLSERHSDVLRKPARLVLARGPHSPI